MLAAGIIYAWSIINAPFMLVSDGVILNAAELGINYTLTIVFFCIGGFCAGVISKQTSTALRLILSALMVFASFFSSSLLVVTLHDSGNYFLLYLSYGMLGGLGIGMAYVTVITAINAWYPDRRGFASGVMLMGFGLSLLIIGRVADILGKSEAVGWRNTYIIIAISIAAVLFVSALFIKYPPPETEFPTPKSGKKERINEEPADYTTSQMIRRPSFILVFIYITILAALGNAAIGFAKDILLDVGSTENLAVTAVGMLGLFNGLGRLISGWLFDRLGIKQTQLISSVISILAPLMIVAAITVSSSILGLLGLCLCGFSFGFAPTTSSVLTSEFYGAKNFPLNFSIMNLILIPAPFAAMLAGNIKSSTGEFMQAFLILAALTVVGFFINMAIRKP
jgi:OFA family oxalate/formate antiporter-like MFS transporter